MIIIIDFKKLTRTLKLFAGIVHGTCKAWFYLITGNLAHLKIEAGPVQQPLLHGSELKALVDRIDCIVHRYVFWSKHICFYRSLCRVVVLNKFGYRFELNIGLRNLHNGRQKVKGHCWLSIDDKLFFEESRTMCMYPHKLGVLDNGVVCWMQTGNDATNGLLRQRITSEQPYQATP